jgi:hypothetical protein
VALMVETRKACTMMGEEARANRHFEDPEGEY